MPTLLALTNPGAGSTTDAAVDAVLKTLRESADVELAQTETPTEIDSVLAAHPELDGVVVLGGDGSLHAIVAALHRADRLPATPVGLVPLGTGNDFARSIGLPEVAEDAARLIGAKPPRELDLIVDGEGRVVVNVAHIGIGAEAAAAAQPLKKVLGPFGYLAGALATTVKALSTPGYSLDIRIDSERLAQRGRILQLAVGNGQYVGGGTALLPDADPGDGKLDIAVIYASPLPQRLAYAWQLSRRDHHRRDNVLYRRGSTVEVSGDAVPCTSDGEIIDPAVEHSWRIEPGALRMWA
jgi:diacylglycerol kinase (ATP)